MKDILALIAAFGTSAIALWAAFIAREQLKAMRASSSGQLLANLWEKFDGPEIRQLRRRAAEHLKSGKFKEPFENDELDRLMCWFEMLATLVRNDAIMLVHAEENFRYWIWHYWQASLPQIKKYRTDNSEPRYYDHLQWLVAKMALDNKDEKLALGVEPDMTKLPASELVNRFLEDESGIKLDSR
jgi:hypothetical protein